MTSHEQNLLNELREKMAEAKDIIRELTSLHVGLDFYVGSGYTYTYFPDTVRGRITKVTQLD